MTTLGGAAASGIIRSVCKESSGARWRVSVDESLCVASGQCEIFCPEVFEVGQVSRVMLTLPPPELYESLHDAADACPTRVITLASEAP